MSDPPPPSDPSTIGCPDCGRPLANGCLCLDCPFSVWGESRRLACPLDWPGPLSLRGRALLRLAVRSSQLRDGSHPEAPRFRHYPPEAFDRVARVQHVKIVTRS